MKMGWEEEGEDGKENEDASLLQRSSSAAALTHPRADGCGRTVVFRPDEEEYSMTKGRGKVTTVEVSQYC
jgi:hypothetical protein